MESVRRFLSYMRSIRKQTRTFFDTRPRMNKYCKEVSMMLFGYFIGTDIYVSNFAEGQLGFEHSQSSRM